MGLAEKRRVAQLRGEVAPRYQEELRSITGSDIKYQIDWDSFVNDMTAMNNLEDKALKVLNAIFTEITVDAIGKEAVASEIKQIHLSHGTTANIQDFTLRDGTLELPWDWSGWAGSFYPSSVREKIEAML